MEHRWGYRRPVDLLVKLVGMPGSIGVGRLRDVSASGAFLQTGLELRLLSRVRIEPIGSTTRSVLRFDGHGYVVRKVADGVGIEWFTPAPAGFWTTDGTHASHARPGRAAWAAGPVARRAGRLEVQVRS